MFVHSRWAITKLTVSRSLDPISRHHPADGAQSSNDELLDFQWFGQSKLGHHQHWEQLLSLLPRRRSTNAFLATIDEKDKKIEMISIASKVLTTAAEPAASRHIKGQISRNNNAKEHMCGAAARRFSRCCRTPFSNRTFTAASQPPGGRSRKCPNRPLSSSLCNIYQCCQNNSWSGSNSSLGLLGALDLCSWLS